MLTAQEDIPDGARFPKRDIGLTMPICQAVELAKRYGYVMVTGAEDQACPLPLVILGFAPRKKRFLEGDFVAIPPSPDKEVRAKYRQENIVYLEYGKYKYAVIAPINRTTFEPHFVMLHVNGAQINRLAAAVLFARGTVPPASLDPGGSCIRSWGHTLVHNEYQAVIPGTGERSFALTQDDEIEFTIPVNKIDELLAGFEESQSRGAFRYPAVHWLEYQMEWKGLPGYPALIDYLLGEDE